MSTLAIDTITATLIEAVCGSMRIVQQYQLYGVPVSKLKDDGTSVTVVDLESEAAALAILAKTGLDIWPEEAGVPSVFTTEEVIFIDPIDGTRPFIIGAPTSVVIAATYHWQEKRMTRCVIGVPANGKVWVAVAGEGCWVFVRTLEPIEEDVSRLRRCNVWQGELNQRSTVLLGLYPGFKKSGYPVIEDRVWGEFFASLYGNTAISNLGASGIDLALVANGGEGVAGSVASGFSGPWDIAGVLMVLEAGGYARAFDLLAGGELVEVNPLTVPDVYFLVTGNNQRTVNTLVQKLHQLKFA